MVCCSISNCGNSSTTCNYTNKRITFHRFPQDPDIKDKWINATGKRNWFPTNYSRICSVHFNDDDFMSSKKRRILNKSAIPAVNIWRLITGKPSDDRDLTSPTREPVDPCVSTTPYRKRAFQSVDSADKPQSTSATCEPGDSDTPRKKKLRREIQTKHLTIAEQRLKIKRLQCKARRYRKKILELKDLVKNLEDKLNKLLNVTTFTLKVY